MGWFAQPTRPRRVLRSFHNSSSIGAIGSVSIFCLALLGAILWVTTITLHPSGKEARRVGRPRNLPTDLRHDNTVNDNKGGVCLKIRNVKGISDGEWLRQPGLHNDQPYYYNPDLRLYLYMTQPVPDRPHDLYYTVNPRLHDTSVLSHGYCGVPGLNVWDCGAQWRANYVPNAASRFEACA